MNPMAWQVVRSKGLEAGSSTAQILKCHVGEGTGGDAGARVDAREPPPIPKVMPHFSPPARVGSRGRSRDVQARQPSASRHDREASRARAAAPADNRPGCSMDAQRPQTPYRPQVIPHQQRRSVPFLKSLSKLLAAYLRHELQIFDTVDEWVRFTWKKSSMS